jgi:predicted aspartyl protease
MGITTVELEVANVATPKKSERLEFLVDSGAIFSVVPATTLRRLGIKSREKQEFRLANGDKIVRRKGAALFRFNGRTGAADVIFGEKGDATLLGAFTLESLGLALDPLKRELREIPMILY